MTRLEAANEIARRINANADYSAKVWSKNGQVRVYLTADSGGKKGFVEAGEINCDFDGSIVVSEKANYAFRYDKAFLAAAVEGIVSAVEAKPEMVTGPRYQPEAQDEDVAAFEASQRAVAASERD